MKKVIVYQVNKTEHVVTGDHLELLQYSYDQITPIRDSDKFENLNDSLISKCAEIGDLKHEVVVLNMDIGTLKADKTFLENECLQLKTKLSKIAQMNWWKRILFIFKGWKYDNGTQ